jgi:hypothetical protein
MFSAIERSGREAKGLRLSRGLPPLLNITLWSAWGHLYLCIIDHVKQFNRHSCSASWDSMALQIETHMYVCIHFMSDSCLKLETNLIILKLIF